MLDTDTKRRIDAARDILVGKLPDPKSQVEQITIALIYKFMDDMDAGSEELGGQRKFFAHEFARYGWAKLMRSGLGGFETLNLYAEAIAKMPENPGIPPLFRDIFKNAYLPYRDPETLRAFLKVINEFNYDHSERLGDAFEYLLSVLGSQGDAGQFRTPRHIIDFMVEIVDPKKDETVLDPACGTAGFLISSYKHILKANTDAGGNSTLTPDEKVRLARNFTGYDISPDMVRLSLVNMYLHGFADPHIAEYDTLTSLGRWNEYADVILANPPFMSPKGGIRPHNRFSIQSSRSEVLFVDYMAEHLKPTGRAGIIVPEGIVFQTQTAYARLRKMLVEQFLVAVVSMPSGVFNPYSGVKTCILILDKSLAKKTNAIAFFKVENDGFGLGAQRRQIDKNDLPRIQSEIGEYLRRLRAGESVADLQPAMGQIVEKARIAAEGDFDLSGERFRTGASTRSAWPFVPVGEVFRRSVQTVSPESLNGPVTYVGLENITQNDGKMTGSVVTENPSEIRSLKNVFGPGDVLYGKLRPNLNKVWLADRKGICSTDILVIRALDRRVNTALYAYLFRSRRFNDGVLGQLKGAQLPRVGWSSFAKLDLPLPPREVQDEIAEEIEGYQKVIDGARAVVNSYRPHIPISSDWPTVALGSIVSISSGGTPSKGSDSYWTGDIPWVSAKDMKSDVLSDASTHVSEAAVAETATQIAPIGALLILVRGMGLANGVPICELARPCAFNQDVKALYPDETANATFLRLILKQLEPEFRRILETAAHGTLKINTDDLRQIKLPLPPLATQKGIVAEIAAEQRLVDSNRQLIETFEKKVQTTLARVWGEDATP
jgi:type I restriction enzyme M protein